MAELDSISQHALAEGRKADALRDIRSRLDLEWPEQQRLPDDHLNAHTFRLQGRLAGALRSRLEGQIRDVALELGALGLHLLLTAEE